MDGPILTHVPTIGILDTCMRTGGYDAVKVVTGWGLPNGWDEVSRRRVCSYPHVVVRTVLGDPSYDSGNPAYWFLETHRVLAEVAPWLAIRPNLMIELGNEPNVIDTGADILIWRYRYYLHETITLLRNRYPQAKLISPAPIMDVARRPDRWFAIMADAIRRCDYVGLHAYEHTNWMGNAPSTGDLGRCIAQAQAIAADRPWLLTEYGINDPLLNATTKGTRYAQLRMGVSKPVLPANIQGAFYYHLDLHTPPLQPQYVIYPSGDAAFRRTRALSRPDQTRPT